MKPENQRIAAAEFEGCKPDKHPGGEEHWHSTNGTVFYFYDLPDYAADLNAMARLEAKMPDGYWYGLYDIVNKFEKTEQEYGICWINTCKATAAQRLEAFLRTVNLWREE